MFISPAYAQAAGGGAGGFEPIVPDHDGPDARGHVLPADPAAAEEGEGAQGPDRRDQARRPGRHVGGIIGTVAKVRSDTEVELEIADGVRVRIVRGTITEVLAKTGHLSKTVADEEDEEEAAESRQRS